MHAFVMLGGTASWAWHHVILDWCPTELWERYFDVFQFLLRVMGDWCLYFPRMTPPRAEQFPQEQTRTRQNVTRREWETAPDVVFPKARFPLLLVPFFSILPWLAASYAIKTQMIIPSVFTARPSPCWRLPLRCPCIAVSFCLVFHILHLFFSPPPTPPLKATAN